MPVLRRIEEILYAPTQQEGHRILLDAQRAFTAEMEEKVRAEGGNGWKSGWSGGRLPFITAACRMAKLPTVVA